MANRRQLADNARIFNNKVIFVLVFVWLVEFYFYRHRD